MRRRARVVQGHAAEGLPTGPPHKSPLAITGATGAYDGARGTAILNLNGKTTDIEITLRA